MHGRIKVRTSEEQAAAKRKEREKKMKVFSELNQKIFAKRKKCEYDKEALQLTEQMLSANPDFATLWNYRREIFIRFQEESGFTDSLLKLCKKELLFLQGCLKVNPKSYGVWHHRQWMNEFLPEAGWKQELQLCNLFLAFDDRNFHCWDYRRIVTKKAKITAQEEFKFSTEKIQENFSNYSSWHYRSKLLPLIHPDPGGNLERIEESALLNEFELAQNAFFTDPNDQSAWFYHRWLLGRAQPSLDVHCVYIRRDNDKITLILQFSKAVQISEIDLNVRINEEKATSQWRNAIVRKRPCHVWYPCPVGDESDVQVSLSVLDGKIQNQVTLKRGEREAWEMTRDCHLLRAELTATHSSLLQTELDSCKLLLDEEPDNKWTMLTMVLLMRALDPLGYEEDTNHYLHQLEQVDNYRRCYYADLGNKFALENRIERHLKEASFIKNEEDRHLDLSGMDVTNLYHMHHLLLMTKVDLSHNSLRALDGCNFLKCVKSLKLDSNQINLLISGPTSLNLEMLEELSLKDNKIDEVTSLKALQGCTRLRSLDLRGNPLCQKYRYREEVKLVLPSLETLDDIEFAL